MAILFDKKSSQQKMQMTTCDFAAAAAAALLRSAHTVVHPRLLVVQKHVITKYGCIASKKSRQQKTAVYQRCTNEATPHKVSKVNVKVLHKICRCLYVYFMQDF